MHCTPVSSAQNKIQHLFTADAPKKEFLTTLLKSLGLYARTKLVFLKMLLSRERAAANMTASAPTPVSENVVRALREW